MSPLLYTNNDIFWLSISEYFLLAKVFLNATNMMFKIFIVQMCNYVKLLIKSRYFLRASKALLHSGIFSLDITQQGC